MGADASPFPGFSENNAEKQAGCADSRWRPRTMSEKGGREGREACAKRWR
jgi:hypothetical protein